MAEEETAFRSLKEIIVCIVYHMYARRQRRKNM